MKMRPRLTRPFSLSLLALAVLLVLSYFPLARIQAANAGATILPAASGAKPLVNLRNPQNLKITYAGSADSVAALQAGTASPTALASADFDSDGAMDVVAGYSSKNGGVIALYKGNPDAFAPTDTTLYAKAMQGNVPPTFLSKAKVFAVPESPDLIVTGDFNGDGRKDVLVAARGGSLYFLAGDGKGNLAAPQRLALADPVMAMAVTPSGQVAVSTDGHNGPQVMIMMPVAGGLTAGPAFPLPARGTSLEWGTLGGGADLAVGAGSSVVIIYNALTAKPETETVSLPFQVQGLTSGSFIWDRDDRTEIAVLGDDGSIRILQHGTLNLTPLTTAEIKARRGAMMAKTASETAVTPSPTALGPWTIAKQLPQTVSAPAGPLSRSAFATPHLASTSTFDLMVIDVGRSQLSILDTSGNTKSPSADISFSGTPVAALALPQKIDASRDLVVLTSAQAAPMLITADADETFSIDWTTDEDDINACPETTSAAGTPPIVGSGATSGTGADGKLSLREAVCEANNQAAYNFAHSTAAGSYTINLPAGTYNLSLISGNVYPVPPCDCPNNYWDGETGELFVGTIAGQSMSIVGMGATPANTVINQTDGADRVMEEDWNLQGDIPLSLSNMTLSGGDCRRYNDYAPADCEYGGGAVLAGGFSGSTLSITSVVMANNTAGGICVGSCDAPPQNVITGQGGAVAYFGPALTLSSSTLSGNSSYQNGSYGGGASSGGGLLFGNNNNSAQGTQSITNSIFTNNTGGDGGGAELQIGTGSTVTISGSTFTGNYAQQDTEETAEPSGYGGAIDSSQGTGYTLTISNSRIAGNSADVAGSGFSVLSGSGTATDNWWGCNGGPGASGCNTVYAATASTASYNPWLVLSISANPTAVNAGGGTSNLIADLTHNSNNVGGFSVPDGTPVTFGGTLGTVNPTDALTGAQSGPPAVTTGQAGSVYTAGNTAGPGTGTATVDNQEVSTPITVNATTVQITITTNPANLLVSVDNGAASAAPLVETWDTSSSHTIATSSPQDVSAGSEYVFSRWSDSGAISHSITVPSTATTYTASFTTEYQLTTQAAPSADGSVTPASGSYYAGGAIVPVTATANNGFQFSNWTSTGGGFGSSTSSSTNFTMPSAATTVTGNFAPTVTSTSIAVTSVSPSSEVYGLDSQVTITAVLSWTGSGGAPTASNVTIGGNGPSGYSATSCGAPGSDSLACTATYTPTGADTVSSYTESASFSGDSNYTGSSSTQNNNFSITQATSSTSVGSSQNPSLVGQQVTFTATIDGEYGLVVQRNGALPSGGVTVVKRGLNPRGLTQKGQAHPPVPTSGISGTVTWSANTGCAPSAVSGEPGTSQCTTTTLPQGTDTITATYSGDNNHSGSGGTLAGGQVVNPAAVGTLTYPPTLDFGTVYLNTKHKMTGTITNTGTANVTFTGDSITLGTADGAAYTPLLYCMGTPLKPGKSCTVAVNLLADTVGTLTATLNIMDNASGNPQQIGLTANVIDPVAQFNLKTLSFGGVAVNGSKTLPVQLTNIGKTPLDISNVSITGSNSTGFSPNSGCPSSLAPMGGICIIEVTFTPTTKGARAGSLVVTDNVTAGKSSIPISGTGH